MTAVELGADMCALARTIVRGGEIELLAAETLDPAAFPGIDAFTAAVRQTRKSLKLSRRCRAVVWGLPDGAKRNDATVKPLIAPLVGAGFRVERVISPCNALAALARLRMPRGDGATCWLAINRTGVAIVVVRPGQQLYSHSFAWNSNVGSSGSQARLLQRYTLVAFLAPEIRRAMVAAREKGAPIDAIVTCGNLSEIRSLTMPLIEELDVEVESLDSLEGLIVKPDAADRLSEVAAALRIACAGAIARPTRPRDETKSAATPSHSLAGIAAAAVVAVVAFIGWSWWRPQPPPARSPKPATITKAAPKQPPSPNKAVTPAPSAAAATPSAAAATQALKPPASAPQVKQPAPAAKPPAPPTNAQSRPSPASIGPVTPQQTRPGAASMKQPAPTDSKPFQPTAGRTAPHPAAAPARAIDNPDAARVRAADPGPEPLKDPVPRVTAILISSDRRMATIDDGRLISVGDVLGKRVVVAIDERAVVLKEPSGVQIRVGLGGRILSIDRSER